MISRLYILVNTMSRSSGGIENTTFLLAKGFRYIYKTIVLCNGSKSEDIDGVTIIDMGKRKLLARYVVEIITLFQKERVSKRDYILCPMWAYSITPMFIKMLTGARYGVLTHGNDVIDPQKRSLWTLIKRIFRGLSLRFADNVFACSEYTQMIDAKRFPKVLTTVIHPPIEFTRIETGVARTGVIFTLCRLEERKGVQYIIRAVNNLKTDLPELKLYIGGDGPYRQEIEKVINECGIQDRVLLLGRVSEEQKAQLYEHADLFILPSVFVPSVGSIEGFGIVFLEANMYGKPVIGSQSGGIPYAIKDGKTGWIVKEGDVLDLQERIARFYSSEIRCDKNDCYDWASEHDYMKIVKKYQKVIDVKDVG